MSDTPAVELLSLTRRFGDHTAVDGLSLDVGRGELFGLVGPDGAGKTTTLRMLAGILRPSGGDARILGTSVTQDPERVKHDIAYMSQRFGLYADLTVMENLDFYADLYSVSRAERSQRVERLFAFSNLGPFANRLAGQLSGGMKQKLGLSCALIHQPDVLLLDEPTFGVDPISRRDLWLIVHEMVASGVTVVVSTAYMDEAERFDRLALLHRGRCRAIDAPDALRAGFAGELLAVRCPALREARRMLSTQPGVVRSAAFGESVHITVASADRAVGPLTAALHDAGIEDVEVSPVSPSLEDVFISLVEGAQDS
jgi:ABC-2 type transport system ATP-binding protein